MQRIHCLEFEDQPWFPPLIRAYMQDHLTFMGNISGTAYQSFVAKLKPVLERVGQHQLVDLCSGSGGPAHTITRLLQEQGLKVTTVLTDLFPHTDAYRHREQESGGVLQGRDTPIDATNVPAEMQGFRLLSNGFHHFRPEQARQVLADAVAKHQGIAVIEMVNRSPFSFVAVLIAAVILLLATPFIKPFRLSRLFFTYFVPLVPIFLVWDGFASCLRVYAPDELRALIAQIDAPDYEWDIGTAPAGLGFATYLIGSPKS